MLRDGERAREMKRETERVRGYLRALLKYTALDAVLY